MLLTALKFVLLMWLSLLITALIGLAVAYLFDLVARAVRQRLARRR
jgi:L-cystine uptake protein TcyP (sodium:dicarboxylate symporter family)